MKNDNYHLGQLFWPVSRIMLGFLVEDHVISASIRAVFHQNFWQKCRGGSRASNMGGAILNICVQSARESFWPRPLLRNHTHLIAVKRGNNLKTWKNQWNSSFCLYRQVYQSDFIAKCISDRGFLARRGVLELAMSIEACMLSWLEGGCLSTQSTPPPLDPPLK